MAEAHVDEACLIAIGNAIRAKNGKSTRYYPNQMAAAINAISTGSGSGGSSGEIYLITVPSSLQNQSWTISLDGVLQTAGQSFSAEKGSVITYTAPVAAQGYSPGAVTVTGGLKVEGQLAYCVTSDMTFAIGAATSGVVDPGSSAYDITALRGGEVLYMTDVIEDVDNAGKSDWNTQINGAGINTSIGQNNKVKLEYSVFVPTGNRCAYGPEFIIYTTTEHNERFSVTMGTMDSTQYSNGVLYTKVVEYTVNALGRTFPFYKQYGANSGTGTIKMRIRASNLVQNMTAAITSTTLYPWD